MAETEDQTATAGDKPRRGLGLVGWLVTAVLALGLGGGGFYAMYSGLLSLPAQAGTHDVHDEHAEGGPTAPTFVELDPLMVSVGRSGSIKQLRFRAFLQVDGSPTHLTDLQPRILDIFATYLRAVSVERLEDPTAFLQLRAQLLRRVQLLAGPEVVKDLLIIDFVIT